MRIFSRDLFSYVRTILVLLNYYLCRQLVSQLPKLGNILVIAPHPDDEILGAGGLILSTLEQKKSVYVIYLTDGEGNGVHPDPDMICAERAKLTGEVMRVLGIPFKNLLRFHLGDGVVPRRGEAGFGDVMGRIAHLIDQINPDTVLATHVCDYWPYDHVACWELAEAAVGHSFHKPLLYGYWVWAWCNVRPWKLWSIRSSGLMAIDITPWVQAKQRLVDLYLNSKTPEGKPWSGVLPASLCRAFRFHIEVIAKKLEK